MARSAEEVFHDHVRAVNAGDLQAIVDDYSDAAVLLTSQGVLNGKAGVDAFFSQAFSVLPQAQVSAKQTVSVGNVIMAWWTAEASAGRIDDGVDTFIVENGLIETQTISFTVTAP